MSKAGPELEFLLSEEWHIWLVEFGLTHSVLGLAVHRDTYPKHTKVLLSDCVRIEADVQGGPYLLQLQQINWHGTSMWELRSANGSFRVVCGRLTCSGQSDEW